jgi:hypothetical protein
MLHSAAGFIISVILAFAYQNNPVQRYPLAPDNSLTAPAYIQKGLPAYDRTWSAEDYNQAATVLKTIAATDVTQLPRYGSPKSGSVFARIVSLDNLLLSRGNLLDPQRRLEGASSIMVTISEITMMYLSATSTERVFDSELIELLRFALENGRDIVHLVLEITAAVKASDPLYETLMKGRQETGKGVAQMVNGSLETLTEKKAYRTSELVRLAGTIEKTLPKLFLILPPGAQQELPIRLKRMIEQESESELKEQLTRIAEVINKAKKG